LAVAGEEKLSLFDIIEAFNAASLGNKKVILYIDWFITSNSVVVVLI
jgi:hypothetical protein